MRLLLLPLALFTGLAGFGNPASAAAGSLSLPKPIKPVSWLTNDDFPTEGQRLSVGGVAVFEVTVTSEGLPVRCSITKSSGSSELDIKTCDVMMSRGKFSPATDDSGSPITGIFASQFNWAVNGAPARPKPIDFIIGVQSLPKGVKPSYVTSLILVVGADGRVEQCRVAEDGGSPSLAKVACEQTAQLELAPVKTDKQGSGMRAVRPFRVGFAVEPRSPAAPQVDAERSAH